MHDLIFAIPYTNNLREEIAPRLIYLYEIDARTDRFP